MAQCSRYARSTRSRNASGLSRCRPVEVEGLLRVGDRRSSADQVAPRVSLMLTTAAGVAAEMEVFGEQLKEADVAGATPDLIQQQRITERFGARGDDPAKYAASRIQLARAGAAP